VVSNIPCKILESPPPNANANWKKDTAARPLGPKQWSMMSMYEVRPLSLALTTMRRIVQSVIHASATRRTSPATKPAWFSA
jgi:hypothetical protein